jgi:protein-L-isoaspartate(D-aspartate) O-methyltransferase
MRVLYIRYAVDEFQMSEMDYNQARFNMVEQQVRPWDVLDARVLNVISNLPRELFVPEDCKQLAYADMRIPIGEYEGRTSHMLNPVVEGRLLQSLAITEDDTVLQIGTGTGYITACLATLARHVDSVDINPEMTALAEKNLARFDITNINLRSGDGSSKWEQKRYYDCIAIMGSMPTVPEYYKKALKDNGGRMFVITGDAPVMKAMLVTRIGKNEWTLDELFETSIDPLINAEKPAEFVF